MPLSAAQVTFADSRLLSIMIGFVHEILFVGIFLQIVQVLCQYYELVINHFGPNIALFSLLIGKSY